ncbi:MAG TPA: hypothetical protein VK002_06635 [Rubricoccaceae bacterium]|jgi:hypothetical protein|nr:hypothetical protein [Rubricoccaceae bacterium]
MRYAFLLALCLIAGCSLFGGGPTAEGNYSGLLFDPLGEGELAIGRMDLHLEQDGDDLSGSVGLWNELGPATGSVAGTISDGRIHLGFEVDVNGSSSGGVEAFTFDADLLDDGERIEGTLASSSDSSHVELVRLLQPF